jgi:3-hydroxyacyl-[acyl-carrier-protein] dehydratase
MDGDSLAFITERIPHRPPFLWLDRVVELEDDSLTAEKRVPRDLELFAGHYPEYPLMPGVLLCEAVFQAGAVLLAEMAKNDAGSGIPVLVKILGARFKREVYPGDTLIIRVRLKERVGPAWFLKGTGKVNGRTAVQVEFACALKNNDG